MQEKTLIINLANIGDYVLFRNVLRFINHSTDYRDSHIAAALDENGTEVHGGLYPCLEGVTVCRPENTRPKAPKFKHLRGIVRKIHLWSVKPERVLKEVSRAIKIEDDGR